MYMYVGESGYRSWNWKGDQEKTKGDVEGGRKTTGHGWHESGEEAVRREGTRTNKVNYIRKCGKILCMLILKYFYIMIFFFFKRKYLKFFHK